MCCILYCDVLLYDVLRLYWVYCCIAIQWGRDTASVLHWILYSNTTQIQYSPSYSIRYTVRPHDRAQTRCSCARVGVNASGSVAAKASHAASVGGPAKAIRHQCRQCLRDARWRATLEKKCPTWHSLSGVHEHLKSFAPPSETVTSLEASMGLRYVERASCCDL